MRSFSFVVNPTAGGGAAVGAVVPVARALREAGATVDVTYSPGPRASAALVRSAVAADDVVVAVGGDGMLSSVAGAVASAGGVLGLLPAGRGNDFARALGLPSDPTGIARVLLEADPTPVDLLRLGDRFVAGSVYAGVDARAAEIVRRAHRLPGAVQYPYAAVRALLTYRPAEFVLTVDGAASSHRAANVVVANSAYYGKGMRIAPAAAVDDGWLDVVVISAVSKRELIRALPSVYDGSHVDRPEVTVLRGRSVTLSADRTDVPVGGDGEPLGMLPTHPGLRIDLAPAALRILRPSAG